MQRLSRLEEEQKNQMETRKRKFFAEVLNAVREFQLQIQASMKRRKQRNDGVQVCCLLLFVHFYISCIFKMGNGNRKWGDGSQKCCCKIIWKLTGKTNGKV